MLENQSSSSLHLSNYRQKRGQSSHGRERIDNVPQQQRSGASSSTVMRRARLQRSQTHGRLRQNKPLHRLYNIPDHQNHNHHQHQPPLHPQSNHHQDHHHQHQHKKQNRPPSTHAVILPQGGGLVLVGEGGVRKSQFPRGCEQAAEPRKVTTPVHSSAAGENDVLARLCDPKHFTGTAATGHLPTVVDLEGGVGVSSREAGCCIWVQTRFPRMQMLESCRRLFEPHTPRVGAGSTMVTTRTVVTIGRIVDEFIG